MLMGADGDAVVDSKVLGGLLLLFSTRHLQKTWMGSGVMQMKAFCTSSGADTAKNSGSCRWVISYKRSKSVVAMSIAGIVLALEYCFSMRLD